MKHEQAVPAPLGHGGEELARVALRVPAAGVGVGPAADRLGVQVVEDALHQPGVEQQALDPLAVPGPACVGRLAVDKEGFAVDGDLGRPVSVGSGGGQATGRDGKSQDDRLLGNGVSHGGIPGGSSLAALPARSRQLFEARFPIGYTKPEWHAVPQLSVAFSGDVSMMWTGPFHGTGEFVKAMWQTYRTSEPAGHAPSKTEEKRP